MSYNPPNTNGQATMANSAPVVLASDQSTVPVSVASVPSHAVTNAGTFATQATLSDTTASGTITTQNLVPAGTATVSSAVEITVSGGYDTLVTQTVGTYTGALSLQGTVDGTNWITFGGAATFFRVSTAGMLATIASGVQDINLSNVAGFTKVRITALAAVTGSVAVSLRLSNATYAVGIDTSIPAGSNTIGSITNVSGITSQVVPGTGAANLGKAEDAVHSSSDVGVMALYVRSDTPASLAGTTGDYQPPITDANGNTWVSMGTKLDSTNDSITTYPLGHSYAHISTATTTTVKSGAGVLHNISVNTLGTVASTTTVYDNTAGSGTVIAVINTLTLSGSFVLDVAFATGLTLVTTGTVAPDITVSFR